MEILKIEDLTFTYPLCAAPAVCGVTLGINAGEFAVLCGATGSGKSTLLRLLKREIAPLGEINGRVLYKGTPISELDGKTAACNIGFVAQNPEQQIVTDKVWHELAFGLENMGVEQNTIARRVAEMASYFGIEEWYEKSVSELSGGQKQLLNLASVMVMNPDILLLDEPTSRLDPIAAVDFITTLKKLNTDFSLTVVIIEHRLEELIPICDRLAVLENGRLLANGEPRSVIENLKDNPILSAMPSSVRLYHTLISDTSCSDNIGSNAEAHSSASHSLGSCRQMCPLTVREGRAYIEKHYKNKIKALPNPEYTHSVNKALEFCEVYFRYERDTPDVLCGTCLTVFENEIFCILGGNGSGKTTSLSAAAGLLKPYGGHIKVFGRKLKEYKNQSLYRNCLSLLPQDVGTVFLKNTVREELSDMGADSLELPFDITHIYDKHPYDLSGGEQQLTALAKVLATKPRLLLMDEPTKGLDASKKSDVINILKKLKQSGVTVVIVTHDAEFAAECADRCALFFRGQIVSVGTPNEFFSENRFYTTSVSRMSRGYFENTVTVEQIAELCRKNAEVQSADD